MNFFSLLSVLLIIAGLSSCSSTCPASPNCSSANSQTYQGPTKRITPENVWERDFARLIDSVLDQSLTGKLSAALDSLLAHYPAASVAVALPEQGMWKGARGVARTGAQATIVVVGHGKGLPVSEPDVDYATPYAAGALASTAADLVRFWHAFLSGKVISASAVNASFRELYPMRPLFPTPPGTARF